MAQKISNRCHTPPTDAGRWTLGLALAFLSSFAFVLLSSVDPYNALLPVAFVVMFGLALAAGFVLSSWWATLALVIASAAGSWVGNWVFVQMVGGTIEGGSGMAAVLVGFLFSLIFLGPLILLLLAGVGLGKLQGIALGQPHALSAGEARVSRWIAAFAPVIAGSFYTFMLNNMPGVLAMGAIPGVSILPGILYAIVLAATCLLAGWLLRSWWGLVVVPIVYAGVAALASQTFAIGIGGPIWVRFVLYIVLPAVVMSAIGTAIGMYRAR